MGQAETRRRKLIVGERAERQGKMPTPVEAAGIASCQHEHSFLWTCLSSDQRRPHPAQFQDLEEGKQSRALFELEAFAYWEWEQRRLRSSFARNAWKPNAPFRIPMAESWHSFWLYGHPVGSCNNCEKFEIICWVLTLGRSPGSPGVRR